MATQIKLKNVRLAFPNLFEPKSVNDGKPTHNCAFILPPDHPQIGEIKAAIQAEAKTKWGAKADANLKVLEATDKSALHDGDLKANLSGYPGNLYINASNAVRPKLKALNGRDDLQAADGVLYSGCYVMGIIEIWAQDNSFGKRINASLMGVQFMRDGEAFAGGGTASDEDFGDLSAEAETAVDDLV